MKRWAPPLMRICVLLLLGAIVNVAVAWGCAVRATPGMAYLIDDASVSANIWNESAPVDWPRIPTVAYRGETAGILAFRLIAHDEVRSSDGRILRYLYPFVIYDYRYGWPRRSVKQVVLSTEDSQAQMGRLQLSPAWQDRLDVAGLPRGIIWPGFVINTIFYAAILWLLFAAPFALRRRRRIKRGLCPACAYPVGKSAVCTECGKPIS